MKMSPYRYNIVKIRFYEVGVHAARRRDWVVVGGPRRPRLRLVVAGAGREVEVLAEQPDRKARGAEVLREGRAGREPRLVDVHALLRVAVAVGVPPVMRREDEVVEELAGEDFRAGGAAHGCGGEVV